MRYFKERNRSLFSIELLLALSEEHSRLTTSSMNIGI